MQVMTPIIAFTQVQKVCRSKKYFQSVSKQACGYFLRHLTVRVSHSLGVLVFLLAGRPHIWLLGAVNIKS